jgi:hypothetical protein
MPATNIQVDLIAGESMKIVGPGNLTFQAPGAAKAAAGVNGGGATALAAKSSATASGTIWTGKGVSLGLGLGLGVWGPVILVAVAAGGYAYLRHKRSQNWWPL